MSTTSDVPATIQPSLRLVYLRLVSGILVLLLGLIAIGAPFVIAGTAAYSLLGLALALAGVLEMIEVYSAPDEQAQRTTFLGGAVSVVAGLLLLAQSQLVLTALVLFLAFSFFVYGATKVIAAVMARPGTRPVWTLFNGVVNLVLCVLIAIQWPIPGLRSIGLMIGIRLLTFGWSLIFTREAVAPDGPAMPPVGLHPDRRLGLAPHPEIAKLQAAVNTADDARRSIDAYWCLTFLVTFFAIHVGRMDAEWTLVGLSSPGVAVLGDLLTALFLAFVIILPCRLAWRALTRPVERRAWNRLLNLADQGRTPWLPSRLVRGWLVRRLRFSTHMNQSRRSPLASLRWGLQVGLPLTAILIATCPIWGFSWYFNTENWATKVWDQWAEHRTDGWRTAMVRAVREHYRDTGLSEEGLFRVEPEGIDGVPDFSFLVIGDPGEGDGSQDCLRDQLLLVGGRLDVKFMVVASDVIYPAGAMKDYESNFYLPFKGFTKPVYAVPGNHDWYDALEGFNANFLAAAAARAAMHARVEADHKLTTTTDHRISQLIDEAVRLRGEYGIRAGRQRAPYFEIQAERFALIVVDTGTVRRVDADQWDWLKAALERARGKFIMVILGHPLYAAGRYQGTGDESFAAIHQLLRDHKVQVVMAGDTHDLEYYKELYPGEEAERVMHHFVNGGGGAYLSVGTALDWPKSPPVPDCACYPRTDAVVAKLDRQTPLWKAPLWFWVKHLGAWPSSSEAMASAFDFNRAPFFQSFMEVRVQGSENVIRLIPHGANGRLRWRDLQIQGHVIPSGQNQDDPVEFTIPMPAITQAER